MFPFMFSGERCLVLLQWDFPTAQRLEEWKALRVSEKGETGGEM